MGRGGGEIECECALCGQRECEVCKVSECELSFERVDDFASICEVRHYVMLCMR